MISVVLLIMLILSGKPALASDDHENTGRVVSANARQIDDSVVTPNAHRAKPRSTLVDPSYGAQGLPEPYSSGLFLNVFKLL
jgi:hypothetical protein